MNKTFKKMLSLVIALAMVMAMGLTAFAAEGDITIKFPTDAKYASHQYEVYQIFTGEVGEDGKTLKNLKYGENTKTATDKGKAVTAEDLATLTAITTTNEQERIAAITPFAELSNPVATLTIENSTYEGPAGYYLIKDKDNSLEGESTAEDEKSYTLYILKGKFDAVQNVVIKVDDTEITGTFDGFNVARTDDAAPSASGFEIKLTFTPKGEGAVTLPAALANKNVTIDFEAKLGAGATIGQVGNVNTVKLKFSNNPNSTDDSEEAETPEDTVIVFTYKTIVDKVDPDGRSLKGAAFKLYKKYDTAKSLMLMYIMKKHGPNSIITIDLLKDIVCKALEKENIIVSDISMVHEMGNRFHTIITVGSETREMIVIADNAGTVHYQLLDNSQV